MKKKNKIFISHASEDKDYVARPLAENLLKCGFKVWYDEYSLFLGDSLKASIDMGLSQSDYAVIILSKSFFSKHWTREELDGVAAIESVRREKVLLPILYNISHNDVVSFSPTLAGKKAVNFSIGLNGVVKSIIDAINAERYKRFKKQSSSTVFKSIDMDQSKINKTRMLDINSNGALGSFEFEKRPDISWKCFHKSLKEHFDKLDQIDEEMKNDNCPIPKKNS